MVEKKRTPGPGLIFGSLLTRSRHPSASGRRIGLPPGDGCAARRDPKATGNMRVFYEAAAAGPLY